MYLREISSIPPLMPGEERSLCEHVLAQGEQAEAASRRLIESNLVLVVSIAQRMEPAGVRILDLIKEGNKGLLLALDTFVDSAAPSFSAHAANCIEQAISKAIAESRP